jgi:hypothetical protein
MYVVSSSSSSSSSGSSSNSNSKNKKSIKFEDLLIEVQRMWNVRVIPVIIGVTGSLSRSLQKRLDDNTPAWHYKRRHSGNSTFLEGDLNVALNFKLIFHKLLCSRNEPQGQGLTLAHAQIPSNMVWK